jgi:hypothetical protein
MSDRQRRGLHPRTMDFVSCTRVEGAMVFTFREGSVDLTARMTRQGFFWDPDTADPAANDALADASEPPSAPLSEREYRWWRYRIFRTYRS